MHRSEATQAIIAFWANGKQIRFVLPLPPRNDPRFTAYRGSYSNYERSPAEAWELWEQACRQRWRAIALVIKAKLEAVESGITEFEDEFLAHIVLPSGATAGTWIRPQIEKAYATGRMPATLPMLPPAGDGAATPLE